MLLAAEFLQVVTFRYQRAVSSVDSGLSIFCVAVVMISDDCLHAFSDKVRVSTGNAKVLSVLSSIK